MKCLKANEGVLRLLVFCFVFFHFRILNFVTDIYRVPKDLVVTKVTMEIEVIEARKDTGVSLGFKVFLVLL